MKRYAITRAMLLFSVLFAGSCEAAALTVFGPSKYEVKERYGKENRYQETFRTTAGLHVIKVQNGTQRSGIPDILEMSVNGETLFGSERQGYPLFACFLILDKENTIELNLRDQKPSGMRRPPLTEKFIIITVEQSGTRFPEGVYGIDTWERLKELQGIIQRLKDGEQRSQAITALDLRRETESRIGAVRALGEGRDPRVKDFFLYVYRDEYALPDIRAEAAVSLGMFRDTAMVSELLNGLFQPVEPVRDGAARALSLYSEEETGKQLTQKLERVDSLRKSAIIRSIVNAGWRPIGTIGSLAASPDPHVAAAAIELLGSMRERQATDRLLALLQRTGHPNRSDVILALGASGDDRVVEPLLAIATDPDRRQGLETSLGTAFARLGDRRAEAAIQDMADTTTSVPVFFELRNAFRMLTGKELLRKEN